MCGFIIMPLSAAMQHCVLALALSHIFILFLANTVEAYYNYDQPQTGAAGVLENEYLPNNANSNNGYPYENGNANDDDPDHITSKALLCFDDKNKIYSGCEEAYRLTQTGELHVPPEYTDQFCNGKCLKETHLVLNCIGSILSRFTFFNKATIKDVRETIKEGCSFGSKRGNFNVEKYIQADESSALQAPKFIVFFMVTVALCFLI